MSGSSTGQNGIVAEDKLYGTDQRLTEYSRGLLTKAKEYFVGHTAAVGVMFIDGPVKYPMYLKSGHEGGPWGGTHRGGVPRGRATDSPAAGQAKPTSRRMLKATLPRSCGSGA